MLRLVGPDEVGVHDPLELEEQLGADDRAVESGHEQVEGSIELVAQPEDVVARDIVGRGSAIAGHRRLVQPDERVDLLPAVIRRGHETGPPPASDLLAEDPSIANQRVLVGQPAVDRHGAPAGHDRVGVAVALAPERPGDLDVGEERVEAGERRDGALLVPDGLDLPPRVREERVAGLDAPGDRARVAVDGVDVERVGVLEAVGAGDRAQQVRPRDAPRLVPDDDQERPSAAGCGRVPVVAGGVVDVARDARQALVPRLIRGGDQLRQDVPFDR